MGHYRGVWENFLQRAWVVARKANRNVAALQTPGFAGRSHLNSIQINPFDFDAMCLRRGEKFFALRRLLASAFALLSARAKNFSPLHPCSIAHLLILNKFRCDHPIRENFEILF
jgi:hypothetical protein